MANWIWYPGDFEIYHGMCQNFEREERGFFWPAYWYVDSCYHNVMFSRTYVLKEESSFTVYGRGSGHVTVKWKRDIEPGAGFVFPFVQKKYPLGQQISCPAKEVEIEIAICNIEGLPAVYVEGDVICSDPDWKVRDMAAEPVKAGYNKLFTNREQNPMEFPYTSRICEPVKMEKVDGGILYDFGGELTAETIVEFAEGCRPVTLCYGESRAEALDVELCYLKYYLTPGDCDTRFGAFETGNRYRSKLRAFQYIYIPEGEIAAGVTVKADYKYVDFPQRSSFESSDEELNRIWNVADTTFRLASGIFFLDGIKRDRWIWSGDAYQSYFINQYLFFDPEICKRTILALRGKDPIRQHINTIVDYSMYWIISIENYYTMTGDLEFLEMIYPRMESMMEYCMKQTDELGFIYGRKKEKDWIFIDWARFDKDGTLCAEQMLLARSYQAVAAVRRLLGMAADHYEAKFTALLDNIKQYFWDEEKQAFIDAYVSGKRNVTRHANIFAVLFDYVGAEQKQQILEHVLLNDGIDAITTPYFKFYELEALSQLGRMDLVMEVTKSYWGGMLKKGATTFWEEYKPDEAEEMQYGMYGDKYGKSLCHAWGASPIYIIGRYAVGLRPTSPGYESFIVEPKLDVFPELTCTLPVNQGTLEVHKKDGVIEVLTDKAGGTLVWDGKEYELKENEKMVIAI